MTIEVQSPPTIDLIKERDEAQTAEADCDQPETKRTLTEEDVMVAEFHTAFKTSPTMDLQCSLLREEIAEFEEALAHLIKEAADVAYVFLGLSLVADKDTVEGLDVGAVEQAVSVFELMEQIIPGPMMKEAFCRVHASNMSKLGEDGEPIFDAETGKVLKGPNYKEPDILGLIREMRA